MVRKASAVWSGDLKNGNGTISTESGALENVPYNFCSRFEQGSETNPEELVGGAHAACFSMAFSSSLEKAGYFADRVSTNAAVTLEMLDGGPTVTKSHLTMTAVVAGLGEEKFQEIAQTTKEKCPISRLLKCDITLEARLES